MFILQDRFEKNVYVRCDGNSMKGYVLVKDPNDATFFEDAKTMKKFMKQKGILDRDYKRLVIKD